jgi:choice-of-anchor C domain-containing protein
VSITRNPLHIAAMALITGSLCASSWVVWAKPTHTPTKHASTAVKKKLAKATPSHNLIKNGSFELGPDPGGFSTIKAGETTIPNWTVTGNTVDVIGSYFPSSNGKRCIDMDGTPGPGGLEQTIPTIPGKEYIVHFDLGANPQCEPDLKKLEVLAAGQKVLFTHTSKTDWEHKSWSFTASGPETTIEFLSRDPEGSRCGALLDNVSVVSADGSVAPDIAHLTFAGAWSSNYGPMTLKVVQNNQIRGAYTYKNGLIVGTLSGDGHAFTGLWSQAPSYRPNNDAGHLEFQLSPDGNHFTGRWGYGDSLSGGEWTGTRITSH